MYLKNIECNNYRNLNNLELSFSKKMNVFIGQNGQGKTNLLEAIYFLSLTRSFKTNKTSDIIAFNQEEFFLSANLVKNEFPYHIEILLNDKKRTIAINKNSESKFKDVIGLLNAILFVPEDLQLLKGNPKLRRKLYDVELAKLYPRYLVALSSYYQILKQRNSYLKLNNLDDMLLDSLDLKLAEYGSILLDYRLEFTNDLTIIVNDIYQNLSKSADKVVMKYHSTATKDELSFYDNLKKAYDRDIFLQQTNVGVHRDDLIVYLNDKDASIYGSQGEQRTIILAIKLALVTYIYQITNEYPILLLDDVMSELDNERQENLIKYLNKDIQTFITTTNVNSLQADIINKAKLFSIDKGIVKEAKL
ncbi:DNA replication/repair protein RecF [Erysipelotrichaceae bacterium OttesenSCG-928-M19]|nr:DNA replication/repair protein RecF [Erysipelotrichaceae bacterium OttesenSCG-928-M19]